MPPPTPMIQMLPPVAKKDPNKAPTKLTKAQRAIWDRIVKHASTTLGPDQQDLLVAYCRHADSADAFSTLLDAAFATVPAPSDDGYADYLKAMEMVAKMRARETAAMTSLSVKLRVANSAFRDDVRKTDIDDQPDVWDE